MCGRLIIKFNSFAFFDFCQLLNSSINISYLQEWGDTQGKEKEIFYPTDDLPVLFKSKEHITIKPMYWNLLPHWAIDEAIFYHTKTNRFAFKWKSTPRAHFNIRADTLLGAKKWKELSHHNRCLIPVSYYIEWQDKDLLPKKQKPEAKKFSVVSQSYFFLAGIWDQILLENGQTFFTVAVITTKPNGLMQALPHHRMPAIIPNEKSKDWLNGAEWPRFDSYPDELMLESQFTTPLE